MVPEEHANPDSATIRVMLAIFRSYGDEVQPDPLIFLAGGPGNQTLKGFAGGAGGYFQRALRERDVIFLDQRGMGFSEPSLNCPEVDSLYTFSVMGPLSADATSTVEAAQQCFERLTNDGVNIAAFNTVESAADVADIAQALGYAQINIYGGSYGSTLAMTVMRNHPEIIRSVMLQGITPPQVDLMASFAPDYEHSLNMIFEACAANLNCSTAFPNLEDMFYAVVARFNREPLEIAVTNPLSQASTTLIMDGDYFIRGIQSGMYNSAFLPQLPYIIAAIYNEQYDIIDNMAVDYLGRGASSSEGALFAMRCM
ncbi:MAG: alpha/beta hydrolase, partial [Anaerolineae bacterium]|nr:alpha/beta hydrolase [Anaerolineae bacterium]